MNDSSGKKPLPRPSRPGLPPVTSNPGVSGCATKGGAFGLLLGIGGALTLGCSAPAEVTLRRGDFAIVASSGETTGVQLALEALQRDCSRVLGFSPPVQSKVPAADGRTLLLVVNRAGGVPAGWQARLRPLDGFESHRVYADPEQRRIYLDGFDARGAIYAIYTFSELILGVPPLHAWSSWQPVKREAVVVPGDLDRFFRSPQVRFRAVLPGDTDFFSPWRERDPGNDNRWLETLLRLKLNTVEGYSTVEPGYRMSAYAHLLARYGLALTSHHISGLNTSFATWDAYWRRVRNQEPPALRVANEPALREFFRYNAETVHRSGIENLWTLAFRGARDQPFWSLFEDAPPDEAARAAVINRMLQIQLDTIKEVTGESAPQVRITLYDEMADLMAKGLLRPPATPNLIWTFVAARRDPYPYDDLVRFAPAPETRLGYYMNFGFASTGAHVAPAEGPWKMEFNYRYVAGRAPLDFSVVNVGCVREFLLELSAHARLLWDLQAYDTDRFLREYCAQYFGAAHAAEAAQLYRDYYEAFWEPKRPVFPGMKRQFLFQDLRHARAFDHIGRVFDSTAGGIELNPLRDIGYERVPGRTFRLDLDELGATNQIDALLTGMRRTAPRFEAVAARCDALRSRLPETKRQFFHDNLGAYAGFMAHLSRALEHYVLAYQQRENRPARAARLAQTVAELERAQACLWATQHGVFAEWYSGAEPMSRTFEIDKLKERLRAARDQTSPRP